MKNIIQIKNETNPFNTIFYGIEWNGESFQSIKTNIAYLFYLRQLLDGNCSYEMLEEETLELYQLIFGTTCIVQPYSQKLKAQSFLFTFVSAEYYVLDISNQELKVFIEERADANLDFDMVKQFIINNIETHHPWCSLRPNASPACWQKEIQRISSLSFTLIL